MIVITKTALTICPAAIIKCCQIKVGEMGISSTDLGKIVINPNSICIQRINILIAH